MNYKEKIEYANKVAKQLQNNVSKEKINAELKSEGLYDRDITNIFISAKNVIGESYREKISNYLKSGKDINDSEEFHSVDPDIIESLKIEESRKLALAERSKMTTLLKEGSTREYILENVDYRFFSQEQAIDHLDKIEQIKHQNSGSGRMLNVGGGIGLIVLTGVIFFASGRLFYVLPIIGLVAIIRGFTTERMD